MDGDGIPRKRAKVETQCIVLSDSDQTEKTEQPTDTSSVETSSMETGHENQTEMLIEKKEESPIKDDKTPIDGDSVNSLLVKDVRSIDKDLHNGETNDLMNIANSMSQRLSSSQNSDKVDPNNNRSEAESTLVRLPLMSDDAEGSLSEHGDGYFLQQSVQFGDHFEPNTEIRYSNEDDYDEEYNSLPVETREMVMRCAEYAYGNRLSNDTLGNSPTLISRVHNQSDHPWGNASMSQEGNASDAHNKSKELNGKWATLVNKPTEIKPSNTSSPSKRCSESSVFRQPQLISVGSGDRKTNSPKIGAKSTVFGSNIQGYPKPVSLLSHSQVLSSTPHPVISGRYVVPVVRPNGDSETAVPTYISPRRALQQRTYGTLVAQSQASKTKTESPQTTQAGDSPGAEPDPEIQKQVRILQGEDNTENNEKPQGRSSPRKRKQNLQEIYRGDHDEKVPGVQSMFGMPSIDENGYPLSEDNMHGSPHMKSSPQYAGYSVYGGLPVRKYITPRQGEYRQVSHGPVTYALTRDSTIGTPGSSLNLNSTGSEDASLSDGNQSAIPVQPFNTPVDGYVTSTPINSAIQVPTASQINAAMFSNVWSSGGGDGDVEMSEMGRHAHNAKERQRRARIKMACERMREVIPGVTEKTDKATVFEFAIEYLEFLKKIVGSVYDKEFLKQCSPYYD